MAWPTTSRQSRGYGAAHDRMRRHLIKTVGVCQECERNGRLEVGTIAEHVVPKAQGGTDDRSNYELWCKACADLKTIREKGGEPRTIRPGVDKTGRPTDPRHPWNRG